MKTFDCACGVRLAAEAEDDLVAIAKEDADEQHGGDPMYSTMELDGQLERSADEEDAR